MKKIFGAMGFSWIIGALLVFVVASAANDEEEHKAMVKRQINSIPLVYPLGGTYKLLIGMSAPIKAEDFINLAFAANFQYQYQQFQNITQLSQYYFIKTVQSREQREVEIAARRDERLTFYTAIADMLQSKGMDGEECVNRAICEAAQYPVEEEGLVGEILHILLTPDYGKSPFDEKDQELEDLMASYYDAATAGRQMFNCASIYPGCPEGQGLMEMFSVLRDE